MHEPLLAQAALPAPTVILGLPMRPYSLGHELFLIRQGNPLVTGEGELKPEHIREAALVCSETWEGAQDINRQWLIRLKLWVWRIVTRNANLAAAVIQWRNYRALGSLCFKTDLPANSKSGRQPGAPFLLRLAQWLIIKMRKTEGEAWNYQLGLAKMQYAAWLEEKRALDILNEDEKSFDDYVAEQEAKAAKEAQCPA